ncbi:MAG: hypothetical protein SPK50_07100 [Mobiluncus porci]|uniref:hypothetical protein n=1 Tax=Mobiluncus porci TaxID=2652278 RepID=UPI0023F08F93|nr:hypothetical protein [Mobiluncus porci]MDD7541948.1 hypothetical protein [Mobiluncus porci]MDY5748881.1 hypothetical protein [Mobiluncus porci]
MSLKVAVVDRANTLFQGQAAQVVVPSAEGDLGILPGHQPLLVVLRPGTVRVIADKTTEIPVSAGFASTDNDAVTVVLERDLKPVSGELAEEIEAAEVAEVTSALAGSKN